MLPPWMIDKVRRDKERREQGQERRIYDDPFAEYEKINPSVRDDPTFEPIVIEVY